MSVVGGARAVKIFCEEILVQTSIYTIVVSLRMPIRQNYWPGISKLAIQKLLFWYTVIKGLCLYLPKKYKILKWEYLSYIRVIILKSGFEIILT